MFLFVYTTNSVSALVRGLGAKRDAFQEHLGLVKEYLLLEDLMNNKFKTCP